MPAPDLLPRLAAFARLLHDAGVEAGPGRLTTATRALGEITLRDQAAFRDSLRACFVSRKDALPLFEAAFDIFWAPPDPRIQALRRKDFEDLTWQETEQVKRLLQQAPWRIAERRTRRLRPSRGGRIDLRRTARQSIRSSGELIHLMHRQPRMRRRPLVLLCDVSGSMERYSRLLLIFAHAIARREDVETFVFSTRLTRITRMLRRRDLDRALTEVGRSVHDFSGGTRIGQAIADFNRRWARRVLGHGAIVIVVSDGWDRGDPGLLAAELSRLRRSSHRLIWLNPLLGSAGYEPVTRGMAAALPYTDDFLAAHNVQALDELGALLAGLERRRPARR